MKLHPVRAIRVAIPLLVFLSTLLAVVVILLGELWIEKDHMRLESRREVDGRLARTQFLLEYFSRSGALDQIQQLLANYGSDERVVGAWLIDGAGNVIAAMRRDAIAKPARDAILATGISDSYDLFSAATTGMANRNEIRDVVERDDAIAAVALIPLASLPGELRPSRYGTFFYIQSLRPDLNRAISVAGTKTIAMTILIAVIAFIFSVLLHRLVVRRIASFKEISERFADGNLDIRMPTNAQDELDAMATAFNNMADRVASARLELTRLNAELEQRVRDRTTELENANNELDGFCYSVSHDLRAPLRAIDGFSKALAEDNAGQLNKDGLDYLTRIRSATHHMSQLIDDMLALSRLSRTDLRAQTVDLSALATEVVGRLKDVSPTRDVWVSIQPNLQAIGDRALFQAMLENLLGNAWKFTGKTASARIEFGKLTTESGDIYFVRDNGAGFDMRYSDKLFSPFQRLHSRSEFEGTGIGLASVRRIILRHGGRIWAEGKVNAGATFYFTLNDPVARPQAAPLSLVR